MGPGLKEAIGSNSDHALQVMTFSVRSTIPFISPVPYRAATLNMLNRCFDKSHCRHQANPYSNNPLSINETDAEYVARKVEQLQTLSGLLDGTKIDVLFLQEADVFCLPIEAIVADLEQRKKLVENMEIFNKVLELLKLTIVVTKRSDGMKGMMATIYKNGRFSPAVDAVPSGCFDDPERGTHAGFVIPVIDKIGGRVDFVNIHLDYEVFYDQVIVDRMYVGTQRQVTTIMAGDTNRSSRLMPIKVSPKMPSVITATSSEGHLTALDLRVQAAPESADYDSFFVSPPSRFHFIETHLIMGDEFKRVDAGPRFYLTQYKGQLNGESSPSFIGQPLIPKLLLAHYRTKRLMSGAPFLDRAAPDSPYYGTVVQTQRAAT